MRNLDIADTRDKLLIYASIGLLANSEASPMPLLSGTVDEADEE
jgi:hypothetical protein